MFQIILLEKILPSSALAWMVFIERGLNLFVLLFWKAPIFKWTEFMLLQVSKINERMQGIFDTIVFQGIVVISGVKQRMW